MTMISKLVEQGEDADVFDLFNGVVAKVEEIRKESARETNIKKVLHCSPG